MRRKASEALDEVDPAGVARREDAEIKREVQDAELENAERAADEAN